LGVSLELTPWRAALGRSRLLVSGFGRWGGGAYDLTSGVPEALDDLATSGLALGGGRLWRLLRAPGEQTSTCELLSYDERGVRSYERIDAVRDPHDVCWHDGALHLTSSWDDTVWRLAGPGTAAAAGTGGSGPIAVWRGGARVADGWHVNSLTVAGGSLHACAFGRFDRHKGWKDAAARDTGFVVDLRTGRDVLTGLCQPHTPRRVGDRWFVCESLIGTLTECAADGSILRRASIERFTRGLAVVGGRWALVGGNGHRQVPGDRAEVVVVDLMTMRVVERIPLPCMEVYDIVAAPPGLARGLAMGFGANPARAVEQHRAAARPEADRPTPPDARLTLASPRVAAGLAGLGRRPPADSLAGWGLRGRLAATMAAGSAPVAPVEVVNRSRRPLASVPPRVVKVAARWIPLPDGDVPEAQETPGEEAEGVVVNPAVALPRLVMPGERVPVDVPLEVPAVPGRYQLRVALGQSGVGWFGVRLQATVDVVSPT
jgi:hypothetical protein